MFSILELKILSSYPSANDDLVIMKRLIFSSKVVLDKYGPPAIWVPRNVANLDIEDDLATQELF